MKVQCFETKGNEGQVKKCYICGKSAKNEKGLKIHMSVHNEKISKEIKHVCPICNKRFARPDNVTKHVKEIHCKFKAFSCNYCDKKFKSTDSLKRHKLKLHEQDPNKFRICQICKFRTYDASSFLFHMKNHQKLDKK